VKTSTQLKTPTVSAIAAMIASRISARTTKRNSALPGIGSRAMSRLLTAV
jgi:hypothetical protein